MCNLIYEEWEYENNIKNVITKMFKKISSHYVLDCLI